MQNRYRLYKGAWIYAQNPHEEQKLSDKDVELLLKKKGLMVRNVYDFDCGFETSFWYVIKDHFGGMEELSTNTRSKVRRCFKTMQVKKISPEQLISEGYTVYSKAAESYRIKLTPPTFEEFKKRVRNSEENEFYGVFDIVTNKLVAFSMNFLTVYSCEYRTLKALPEYMKKYAYYGLIYEMNRYYLEERGLKYVSDGARSITNHSNIQPYLIDKFKFRKAYCRLQVKYKLIFGFIVKMLYPFRKIIPLLKVQSILRLEEYSRNNR